MRLRVGVLALVASCIAACSLLIDSSGLAGDPSKSPPPDAANDAPVQEASVVTDAGDADDGAPATHPYVQAVLADGPSLYYRLEETSDGSAKDETGNHPGVYRPGSTHGVPGAFPGSLALRQTKSGGIDPGDIFDFAGTAAFTLEAWFRPDGYDGEFRFLFHHDDQTGQRQNYGVFVQASTGLSIERYVDGSGRSAIVDLPPLGQWCHIVGVYTGTNLRLYVDGRLVRSSSDSRGARAKDSPLRIAYGYPAGDGALIGTLDEVAIYEKALGDDRIRAHFEAAK